MTKKNAAYWYNDKSAKREFENGSFANAFYPSRRRGKYKSKRYSHG